MTGNDLRLLLLAALAPVLGCSPASPASPASPPVAAPPRTATPDIARHPPDDQAVVATKSALVAVSLATGRATTLLAGHATWCAVDNRARVVWALVQGKGDSSTLVAKDLVSADALLLAEGVPRVDTVIIEHGPDARLGGDDPLSYTIALKLELSPRPRLAPQIGCDGDAHFNCYQDAAGKVLLPDVKKLKEQLEQLTLRADPARLRRWAERGAGRRFYAPRPKDKVRPKVTTVPKARCSEDAAACGKAYVFPGTRYWLVTSANSRGDYYHARYQLYDPARRVFFDPRRPAKTSPRPLGESAAIEDVFIAPSGQGMSTGGAVLRFDRGIVFGGGALSCGWIGGGWYLGGARDDYFL